MKIKVSAAQPEQLGEVARLHELTGYGGGVSTADATRIAHAGQRLAAMRRLHA